MRIVGPRDAKARALCISVTLTPSCRVVSLRRLNLVSKPVQTKTPLDLPAGLRGALRNLCGRSLIAVRAQSPPPAGMAVMVMVRAVMQAQHEIIGYLKNGKSQTPNAKSNHSPGR